MNDYVEFPSTILKQILAIRIDFDQEFMDKMPLAYDAINKIENNKVKLAALIDLDNEAQLLISDYIKKYSHYLWGILDWIKEKETQNETISFNYNDVYDMFFEREVIYRSFLIKLTRLIEMVKVTIQVKEKYLPQSPSKSKLKKLTALEINEEFHKLFISPVIEGKFIALLKKHEYITDEEKWKGISDRPGELREAYQVLKNLDLLQPGKHALTSLRIFYQRFGLRPEEPGIENHYISTRSLGDKNTTKDYDLFLEIFQFLAPKSK